jgi:hypothetical protein
VHQARQLAIFHWHDDKVKVVRHQAIGQELGRVAEERRSKDHETSLVVMV